jgi:hypothetical protein
VGIRELRKLASTLGIKNYSKYRKDELQRLVDEAQAAQAPAEPEGTLVVVTDGENVPEGLPEDAEVVVVDAEPDLSERRFEVTPPAPVRRRPLFHRTSAAAVAPIVNMGRRQGRNERCACGSGLKYKKCCMRVRQAS